MSLTLMRSSKDLRETTEMAEKGRLILVVGPSGSGKDTLLDAARVQFNDDNRLRFARRDITRSAASGGERHREVSVVEFEDNLRADRYALHWDAHQLRYGVRREELAKLEDGASVVVNGSRAIIDEATRRFPGTHVLSIRVGLEVLEQRLRARGREDQASIARRLERAIAFELVGPHVTEVWNEGPIEEGQRDFCRALEELIAAS